ncbi:MAG: DUF4139 domain-containing protein [Rhodospirillales bacterium]|nr:DUF4139 domain-containing protein [Rhodospirillales bacterium]
MEPVLRSLAVLLAVLTNAAAAAEIVLPASDRAGLDLAIYANGLTVVQDRRPATLAAGASRLAFPGVSGQMIPESAIVSGEGLTVNIVDYDFATLSPDALLRRSVGHEVGVVRVNPTTGEESVERATLLSADPGIVLKYRDRIETKVPGRLIFDEVPDGLGREPALAATVHADAARDGEIALTYLTTGLDWKADYVAVLDEAAGRIDLSGRAIVRNASGGDFTGARLSLVAGEVRRISASPRPRARGEMMEMAAAAPPAPAPEGLGSAYLYRLPAPTDLADRQSRQFTLLNAANLPVEQRFVSESSAQAFAAQAGEVPPSHPNVSVRFANPSTDAGGMPLPAGIVRVYAASGETGLVLLGEDRISDSPAGASVALETGAAFDITVQRRQTDFSRVDLPETVFESGWSIELANAKRRPVNVDVVEDLPGDWEILGESAEHVKTRADQATWTLTVPAGGRTTLEYRVRVRQ